MEDEITLICSEEDFGYLAERFENVCGVVEDLCGFEKGSEMLLEVSNETQPGELQIYVNGVYTEMIPIIFEEDLADNRILH